MHGIAVDATGVYWNNIADGTVMKLPLAGGPAVTLASGQLFPYGIGLDATNVYWTNNFNPGAVMAVPQGGGAATTLVSVDSPADMAVDVTGIYWVSDANANVMKFVACQNGGVCENGAHGYACTCAAGFTGTNCEIDCALDGGGLAPCTSPQTLSGLRKDRTHTFTLVASDLLGHTSTTSFSWIVVYPASCGDIKFAQAAAADGYYVIDVDGIGPTSPQLVYCDMTTNGGGTQVGSGGGADYCATADRPSAAPSPTAGPQTAACSRWETRPPSNRAESSIDEQLAATTPTAHRGGRSGVYVQRTDSALRLSVHFHTIAVDGVYVCDAADGGMPRFLPPPEPSPAEAQQLDPAVDDTDAETRAMSGAAAVGACASAQPGAVTAAWSGPTAGNAPSASNPSAGEHTGFPTIEFLYSTRWSDARFRPTVRA